MSGDKTHWVPSTTIQRNLGEYYDLVRNNKATVVITAHSRPMLVMIPFDEWEQLVEARRESIRRRLRLTDTA